MSTFQTTATTTTTIPFHNNINHKRRAKTPSFSSILLDAIYRSIDDTYTNTDSTPKTTTTYNNNNDEVIDFDYTQVSKQRRSKMRSDSNTLETINLRHAIMIDSWIDKQSPPTPPQPRPQQQQQPKGYCNYQNANNHSKIKFVRQKSVPYRSTNYVGSSSTSSSSSCFTHPKRETSSRIFNKTKLKALKIYSDLKKSKQQRQHQPVSPGARIAAFLNSIFRNAPIAPPRRSPENPPLTTMSTSTCSSASSFTRSCMSKTTISTEKSNRSVRFYPVNTFIVEDEDDTKSLCRKNNLHNVDDRKLLVSSTKAAFDHQQHNKKLKKENEIESMITKINRNRINNNNNDHSYKELLSFEMCSDEELMKIDDENDDEDDESCASSDLFELENLSSIGVSTFSEELPVYGTTSLKKLIS